MTARTYLPAFSESTATIAVDQLRDYGRLGTWTPDSSGGYATSRTIVANSAPWTAVTAMREWCVDRAMEIAASGAPDANDYREVIGADGDGWDIIGLCERMEVVLMTSPSLVEDAWSIGPWWARKVALVDDVRWTDELPAIPSRMVEHVEATARHKARTDGTFRTSRRRANISIGGAGRFTADGKPVPAAMAAIAALLPEQGATAQDAYAASIAMQSQGLIPPMLGGEDWAHREETPELPEALIDHVSEGWRKRTVKGRRVARRKDGAYVITERVSDERTRTLSKAVATRGTAVLVSEASNEWARSHVGDAVVVLAPRADVERTTELRRPMGRQRKVTACLFAPDGQTAPVSRNATAEAHRSIRAEILARLATLDTADAATAIYGWQITVESAATSRHAARLTAQRGNDSLSDTPRGMATQLARLSR